MSDLMDKEFNNVEQLINQAKFNEAFQLITILEKKIDENTNEHVELLILKGKLYSYQQKYKEAVELGERAYLLSTKIGISSKTIDALIIKAYVLFLGKAENALQYISEAERLLIDSYDENQKADCLLIKSFAYHYKTEHNKALELAFQWLELHESQKKALDLAFLYYEVADMYIYKGELNKALDYANKSLSIREELGNQIGIVSSLYLIGLIHFQKGDFDQSLRIVKGFVNNQEISIAIKLRIYHLLGAIYKQKGEVDRSLKYYNKAAKLAKKEGYMEDFIESTMSIGSTYRMKGEIDEALKYLQLSMETAEKYNSPYGVSSSLFYLILTNLDNKSQEQAELNLVKLEHFTNQSNSKVFDQVYMVAKALVLKSSGRIRNRTEAELLLKQITEDKIATPHLYLSALVSLSEIFLEELEMTNNSEVLEELNPLISRISKIAEKQNAYLWLAEIKLLQGKLALIQAKIKDAEELLTQAQQIAELHGLNLLSIKISNEHDNLLDQLNFWKNLEKEKIPMSERIKLASVDGVIDRMQGKRVVKPTEPSQEIPVLLLIIGEGGFPLFSNSFTKEWDFEEDLISGFLSAFDSFSGELFAKRLDRAKFGDYTILMQSVTPFSVCYLFKGQTYFANQKLTKFVESIKSSNKIWEIINIYYNTNRVVELKDHPSIELLINDIFIKKIQKLMS
ncbi:MAG: tetratricopeptide repeat protein [Promethearchaeota archaeon]